MPGWVKRGAVDPTFSTDTCNVCDPRVCHQSKAFLGAVLRGFSLQAPKVPCDRVRLALVCLDHSHFAQDPVQGCRHGMPAARHKLPGDVLAASAVTRKLSAVSGVIFPQGSPAGLSSIRNLPGAHPCHFQNSCNSCELAQGPHIFWPTEPLGKS